MNPLFQQMNNNTQNPIIQRFQQFKQQFRGNPQEQVQQLFEQRKDHARAIQQSRTDGEFADADDRRQVRFLPSSAHRRLK